jgi:hypothetical protein
MFYMYGSVGSDGCSMLKFLAEIIVIDPSTYTVERKWRGIRRILERSPQRSSRETAPPYGT